MTKPITPDELVTRITESVPDGVVEAWNEMIAKRINGGGSRVTQRDLVELICKKMGCCRVDVFVNGWLHLEPMYEAAGWKVEYDKPGFNEPGDATFTFTRKDQKQ